MPRDRSCTAWHQRGMHAGLRRALVTMKTRDKKTRTEPQHGVPPLRMALCFCSFLFIYKKIKISMPRRRRVDMV